MNKIREIHRARKKREAETIQNATGKEPQKHTYRKKETRKKRGGKKNLRKEASKQKSSHIALFLQELDGRAHSKGFFLKEKKCKQEDRST
jgi:hypothetical protein